MWQFQGVARPRWMTPAARLWRRNRAWLLAVALVPAIAFSLSACNGNPVPPQPQVITDKGTPFGDLLVPKLTASVKDGAVGVSVESPVTVSAEDGGLGAVSMVDDADGTPGAGPPSATAVPVCARGGSENASPVELPGAASGSSAFIYSSLAAVVWAASAS